MELLSWTMTAVKLRSHLDKYLTADADRHTIRQSSSPSPSSIWLIEHTNHAFFDTTIRLRSYSTGLYLAASDSAFLFGMTGKRVVQSETATEWEAVRDGFQIKLRTRERKYLRANGGTPPWRNSVTHDRPMTGATYNWILWDAVAVDLGEEEEAEFAEILTPAGSFSAAEEEEEEDERSLWMTPAREWSPATARRVVTRKQGRRRAFGGLGSSVNNPSKFLVTKGPQATHWLTSFKSAMDLFHSAKAVRLRSHHDKYLVAEEDEESVIQDRNGSSKNARWTVEFSGDADNAVCLKSCYGKYLTASNHPFLFGMTGKKVMQTLPRRLDSSVEWEPIKEGNQVRLKTRYGNFLRANGGVPPWRNSVTHDVPHRSSTMEWILWDVIVQVVDNGSDHGDRRKTGGVPVSVGSDVGVQKQKPGHSDSFSSQSSSQSLDSDRFHYYSRQESNDSGTYSPPKPDGRLIFYHVADEDGEVDDAMEEYSFTFKGKSVEELTHRLEEETGLHDLVVCNQNPLNGKLFPLRLCLPPNNATMHVVVVPSTSIGEQPLANADLCYPVCACGSLTNDARFFSLQICFLKHLQENSHNRYSHDWNGSRSIAGMNIQFLYRKPLSSGIYLLLVFWELKGHCYMTNVLEWRGE
ncbi:hypothetical protein AKJ16_DCAP13462 [Drosera capensis]